MEHEEIATGWAVTIRTDDVSSLFWELSASCRDDYYVITLRFRPLGDVGSGAMVIGVSLWCEILIPGVRVILVPVFTIF